VRDPPTARRSALNTNREYAQKLDIRGLSGWHLDCYGTDHMVPISRRKQAAGIIGAVALGYTLSWLSSPGPGTGPVDSFGRTFGPAAAPVIVAPVPLHDNKSVDAKGPLDSSPQALPPRTHQRL
jgi:hypothetical protein